MRLARNSACILLLMGTMTPTLAFAQSQSLLIEAELPDDFDRGKNVSVREQPRPDYDPIGVRMGSLRVYPKLELSAAATDNVYFEPGDGISDGFLTVSPSVRVSGNFSPLTLNLRANANFRRFFDETTRNEDTWNIQSALRLDLADEYRLLVDLRAARRAETPFSGEVESDTAVLSRYTNFYGRLRGQYEVGQFRATLALDHSVYEFGAVKFKDGTVRSQAERDRDVTRATGQAQYAFSPSLAGYVQLNYDNTSYDRLLPNGQPNRDSDGWRVSAGVNMDLSRLLRGTIGIGYKWKNYDSPIYDDVDGLSVETRLEYFPTELTTYTLDLRRRLPDSNLGSSRAFFDNRASLRVDHSLLRNLIVTAEVEYGIQDYIGSEDKTDIYALSGGVDLALSRTISLNVWVQYRDRKRSRLDSTNNYSEFEGGIGLVAQL